MANYTFTSQLTGKTYNSHISHEKEEFINELGEHGLTLEQYCVKYLKNISTKSNRPLKEGEHLIFKSIWLSSGTYWGQIVNEKFHCEICGEYAGSISSFGTHISRKHGIHFSEYFAKIGYKDVSKEHPVCSFCGQLIEPCCVKWNHVKREFWNEYKAPVCDRYECKNERALKFIGKPLSECSDEFEHIGGKTEYLCAVYKTTPEGLKKIGKSKAAKHPHGFNGALAGFIDKYGVEIGTQKYNERRLKISHSSTLQGYIDRFGEKEGIKRWNEKQQKVANGLLKAGLQASKCELQLLNLLREKFPKNEYISQHAFDCGVVDIYDKTNSIIIEFYGDYWHANPLLFKNDFMHRHMHLTAEEIRKKDNLRIQKLMVETDSPCIIIWEHSFKTMDKDKLVWEIDQFTSNHFSSGTILWI